MLINVGQEKDEAGMKLLNRDTRQNRELYKQIKKKETKKGRKKHMYFIEGRRERGLINKLWIYKIRTVIKNTENSIKMLEN